jgi:hypothetical protein
MHHLVAQHMDDSALRIQMQHLIRSLNPEGMVALQFAAPLATRETGAAVHSASFEEIVTGGFVRTPDELVEIVQSVGGVVSALLPREQWSKSSCQFWVAQIGRSFQKSSSKN